LCSKSLLRNNETDSHLSSKPAYWKNDQRIELSGGSVIGRANAITVSEGDVYIAGYSLFENNDVATYWKNGEAIRFTQYMLATSIAVDANDVYVVVIEDDEEDMGGVLLRNGEVAFGRSNAYITSVKLQR
jgi:hypothetical protein